MPSTQHTFEKDQEVFVRYSMWKFYKGKVLWTEMYAGVLWVTVRPNDSRMIYTFGSSHDISNGYKSYIGNEDVLGTVFPVEGAVLPDNAEVWDDNRVFG